MSALAEEVGTPFYCYSAATIRRHYQVFAQAFAGLDALVCYAVKANSNQAVLRLLAKEGAGMDVVSGGELARALAAGVAPRKITFSGVGKTQEEIAAALRRRHLLLQCRIRAGARSALASGDRDGARGAGVAARQSGRRRAHA